MRCIDCLRYPWRPDRDPSDLMPYGCHPSLGLQRWTGRDASRERECPYYVPREPERQAAPEPAPEPKADKPRKRPGGRRRRK